MTQPPGPGAEPTARGSQRAVFLSYASQDAAAAARICAALRAAGIEVWFDQSALRGGDAWDAAIRRQIKNCALFIPVISRNTHARDEGYFRLEWKLAVDRSHLMATDKTFLLPVVVDHTPDDDERVPDRFRELQWTRLPDGATPSAFAERVLHLLSPDEPVAPVAHATATPPAGAGPVLAHRRASTSPQAQVAAGSQRLSWRTTMMLLAIALVFIATGYLVLDWFVLSKRVATAAGASTPVVRSVSPAPGATQERSIAVLPFLDMSEKKDQEYFSDGLAEEVLDLLAKIPDLHVIARTSSFSFKSKSEDIPTIARQLNVANILEGSVRKSGNRLRVTTQLIRADTSEELWSETYDRELKDVFQVQDEIAGAVVAALKLKLAPGQQASSAHRTSNTEAYNQYLLGRQFFDRSTGDNFLRAVEAYRKAIELDSGYAAAYAGLAMAEFYVADQSGDAAGSQRALAAADKAVLLAPDQADGYAARGYLRYTFSWDWVGGQADFEKALQLNSADSTVWRRYGTLLDSLGRRPDAITATRKAIDLDPLSSPAWSGLGLLLLESRQLAAARDATDRALEIQPDSVFAKNTLGTLQLLEGNAAEALTWFRQTGYEGFRLAGVAMAEYSLGHTKESQQALEELIAKDAPSAADQVAEVYAWRGEKDKAFEWLERAYRQRDGGLCDLKVDLLLGSLRGDPRFAALLRRMQLSE